MAYLFYIFFHQHIKVSIVPILWSKKLSVHIAKNRDKINICDRFSLKTFSFLRRFFAFTCFSFLFFEFFFFISLVLYFSFIANTFTSLWIIWRKFLYIHFITYWKHIPRYGYRFANYFLLNRQQLLQNNCSYIIFNLQLITLFTLSRK